MRGLIAGQNLTRYLSLHRRFHFGLYALAGMPVLEQFIKNLWLHCGPPLTYVIAEYVLSLKVTDFHISALSALRSRNPAAAADAIPQDIAKAGKYIMRFAGPDGWIVAPDTEVAERHRK